MVYYSWTGVAMCLSRVYVDPWTVSGNGIEPDLNLIDPELGKHTEELNMDNEPVANTGSYGWRG